MRATFFSSAAPAAPREPGDAGLRELQSAGLVDAHLVPRGPRRLAPGEQRLGGLDRRRTGDLAAGRPGLASARPADCAAGAAATAMSDAVRSVSRNTTSAIRWPCSREPFLLRSISSPSVMMVYSVLSSHRLSTALRQFLPGAGRASTMLGPYGCVRQGMWVFDPGDCTERGGPMTGGAETVQALIDADEGGLFALDRDLRYTAFNRVHAVAMRELYGAEIALGGRFSDYQTVAEDRERDLSSMTKALSGDRAVAIATSGDAESAALLRDRVHAAHGRRRRDRRRPGPCARRHPQPPDRERACAMRRRRWTRAWRSSDPS